MEDGLLMIDDFSQFLNDTTAYEIQNYFGTVPPINLLALDRDQQLVDQVEQDLPPLPCPIEVEPTSAPDESIDEVPKAKTRRGRQKRATSAPKRIPKGTPTGQRRVSAKATAPLVESPPPMTIQAISEDRRRELVGLVGPCMSNVFALAQTLIQLYHASQPTCVVPILFTREDGRRCMSPFIVPRCLFNQQGFFWREPLRIQCGHVLEMEDALLEVKAKEGSAGRKGSPKPYAVCSSSVYRTGKAPGAVACRFTEKVLRTYDLETLRGWLLFEGVASASKLKSLDHEAAAKLIHSYLMTKEPKRDINVVTVNKRQSSPKAVARWRSPKARSKK